MMVLKTDPCGIVCVLLIYCCVFYADYVVSIWMIIPVFGGSFWGAVHITIFNFFVGMALIAHARAMFTDPGVVPINSTVNRRPLLFTSDDESGSEAEDMILRPRRGDEWTMCTRCESMRPPRAHHCRVCKRCIRKMDHHCPWVNNCVGEFNQKFFLQFLLYVGLTSMYALVILIVSWTYDDEFATTGMKGPFGENAHHAKVLHSIFLSMESVLFGMFVLAVSCDQLSAIFSEETTIESVQRRSRQQFKRARRRTRVSLMKEVCGLGSVCSWLLPCGATISDNKNPSNPRQLDHFEV